jgi:hypothetical protein
LWCVVTVDFNDGLGGRAKRIENEQGDLIAYTGDLALSATTITNQSKPPTFVAEGYKAVWSDWSEATPEIPSYEIKKTLIADTLNNDGVLARMVAGGNIFIDADTFNNLHAHLSAGEDIHIQADSQLNNVAYGAAQTLHEVHKTGCYTCHSGILGYRETFGGTLEAGGAINVLTGNFKSIVEPTRNTTLDLPRIDTFQDNRATAKPTVEDFKVVLDTKVETITALQRNNKVSAGINETGAPNLSSLANLLVGQLTGHTNNAITPVFTRDLTNPSTPAEKIDLSAAYAPFTLAPQVEKPWLGAIETRPPYTDYGQFLSSPYMVSRLNYSPEHEPRMNGEEWERLRQVSTDPRRQGATLLTSNQINIQSTGNITLSGDLKAKQHLNLDAAGNLDSKAKLESEGAVALTAGKNLSQTGGGIKAQSFSARATNDLDLKGTHLTIEKNASLAAGNNLTVGTIQQTGSGKRGNVSTHYSYERGSQIDVGGHLSLVADNDLTVRGSKVKATRQLNTQAGHDLNLVASEDTRSVQTTTRPQQGFFGDLLARVLGKKPTTTTTTTTEQYKTTTGSTLEGGAGINAHAGNNLTSTATINSTGETHLSAGHDLSQTGAGIKAKSLVLVADNDLTLANKTQLHTTEDALLVAGNDLKLLKTTEKSSGRTGDTDWQKVRETGIEVTAGGDLTLGANHDLLLEASSAKAGGKLTAQAGNDLTLAAGENYDAEQWSKTETKKSWGGLKKKTTTTHHSEEHLTHVGSSLEGNTGVSIEAGNNAQLVGAKVKSGSNLEVTTGNALQILATEDKHIVTHDEQKKSSFAGITYSKSNNNSLSERTQASGSISDAMGDMSTTSGGSSTFQASQLNVRGTLNIKAGGGVNLLSFANTDSLNNQSSSTSFGGALSSASADTVQQSTVLGSTLNAKHINIDAQSIGVEASQIQAQTVALIADSVALISGKNSLYENHTRDDSGLLLREIETSGHIQQDAVASTITAESLTLNGKALVDATFSTENLIKSISSEGNLTDAQLTTLKAKLQSEQWHETQTTLSKMGTLIVQAVTTYLTAGVGSGLSTGVGKLADVMVQQALKNAANQVTQAMLTAALTGNNPQLDFDQILKGAVQSAVLAGVNAKLDQQFGLSALEKTDTLGKLQQATLHSVTQTAMMGGDFAKNLQANLTDLAGAELATLIGDQKSNLGTLGYNASHAALGCALAVAKKVTAPAGY